jgi:hypothetical protein
MYLEDIVAELKDKTQAGILVFWFGDFALSHGWRFG